MKTKLLTWFLAMASTVSLHAAITYELNGGITNDYGWMSKNDMFQACMAECGVTGLATLDELKAAGDGSFTTICGKLTDVTGMLNAEKWDWLEAYIMTVQNADLTTPATQLVEGTTSAGWRYAVAAFFLESQRTGWPKSADFSAAGKDEAYIPSWKHAYANPTNPTTTFTLNAPYKEGDTFIGWYTTANFSGSPITTVNASTTSTLYAKWGNATPPCEDIYTEFSATFCGSFVWNGVICTVAGDYVQTIRKTGGCDSIVTMHLLEDCPIEAPNKCGDNLYWHYSNDTMTITGSGAMYDDPDLLSYRTQDWYPARVNDVVFPNEITHIGNVAFADCANLTTIDIPNSVTSIGDGAFSWTGLQSITIPASVTELGEQVFEACNDLHTILYEGNPTEINNQTVHPLIGCVHLDTVIAPAALWHCTTPDKALESRYGVPHKTRYIEVTDGELTNQAVKYIAQNATALEVLDLTNATNTTLPYGAWRNSYQLTQLYLPEQIETLPESMIEGGRNLSEILIPATVTEIGNYAFAGCVNVWHMTVEATTPPVVYENTFDGISRSISMLVPAGSEKAYREANYWCEFFVTDDAEKAQMKAQKILQDDQILILRNGKTYNTMGQLVTNK